jgi:hypothetical protein
MTFRPLLTAFALTFGLIGCGSDDPAPASNNTPAHVDLGEGDMQDVVTIGDSYMSLIIRGIQQSLETISGRDYRNYAVPGTLVLNEQIPGQYDAAVAADADIKTVVMTGGGNDVLSRQCGTCEDVIDQVSARLAELRTQMAEDGVEDVIIVSYGYPADQARHASLDYSRGLLAQQCKKELTPRCHYIDPVEELAGKISADGIHPTQEGYDILGQLVWDLMQAEGVRR